MFTVEPPFNLQNDRVYAPVDNKKRYIDPSHLLRISVMVSVAVSQVGITELIFVNPVVKVNDQYYCNILLSLQMLPAIKHVSQRCLFTKQYVACSKIGHFLCSVITQGKCSKCCSRINVVYTTGATPSASTTTPAYRRRFHLW